MLSCEEKRLMFKLLTFMQRHASCFRILKKRHLLQMRSYRGFCGRDPKLRILRVTFQPLQVNLKRPTTAARPVLASSRDAGHSRHMIAKLRQTYF